MRVSTITLIALSVVGYYVIGRIELGFLSYFDFDRTAISVCIFMFVGMFVMLQFVVVNEKLRLYVISYTIFIASALVGTIICLTPVAHHTSVELENHLFVITYFPMMLIMVAGAYIIYCTDLLISELIVRYGDSLEEVQHG